MKVNVKGKKALKSKMQVQIIRGSYKGTKTTITKVNRKKGLITLQQTVGKGKSYNRVIPKDNVIVL